MNLAACLQVGEQRQACVLQNISLGGAVNIAVDQPLLSHVMVEVEGLPGQLEAIVVGTADGMTHLKFVTDSATQTRVKAFVNRLPGGRLTVSLGTDTRRAGRSASRRHGARF